MTDFYSNFLFISLPCYFHQISFIFLNFDFIIFIFLKKIIAQTTTELEGSPNLKI